MCFYHSEVSLIETTVHELKLKHIIRDQ